MRRICYLFKDGRKSRLYSKERFSVEFFYGYFYLKEKGFEVDIIEESEILDIRKSVKTKILYKIPEKILSFLGINFVLLLSIFQKNIRKKLNTYEFIIATTNSFGLSLLVLKRLGFLKAKIFFIVMGLLEKNTFFLKKLFYNFLFQDIVCSLGEGEAEYLLNYSFVCHPVICYIPFGIDFGFWTPLSDKNTTVPKPYFISIGNDRHRDYEILIKAWLPKYPLLKIVTQQKIFKDKEKKPDNIEVLSGKWDGCNFSDNEIKCLIQQSLGVIIPLKETLQPSGQSVSLQTMACAKPLILTETSGIWSRKYLKHKFNCYLIKQKNTLDLKAAIKWIIDNRDAAKFMGAQARQTVLNHFTIAHFNKNLYSILVDNYV